MRQYSRWECVIPKCYSITLYLLLFSVPLFMPPFIFFGWVNASCEAQHNDFQVIVTLDNEVRVQKC